MGEETQVLVEFPDLDTPRANEEAENLLSELKPTPQLHQYLNLNKSAISRTDKEAQDFGATLIVVLGTPAVITLAGAIKSWIERRGRTKIRLNGVEIDDVRSRDVENIIRALVSES